MGKKDTELSLIVGALGTPNYERQDDGEYKETVYWEVLNARRNGKGRWVLEVAMRNCCDKEEEVGDATDVDATSGD